MLSILSFNRSNTNAICRQQTLKFMSLSVQENLSPIVKKQVLN